MFGIDPQAIANLQLLQAQIQQFIVTTGAMLQKIDAEIESLRQELKDKQNG